MKKSMSVMLTIIIFFLVLVDIFLLFKTNKDAFPDSNVKKYVGHWMSQNDYNGGGLYIFADGTAALVTTMSKEVTVEDPYDAYIYRLYLGYFEEGNVVFNKSYIWGSRRTLQSGYYHQIDEIPEEEYKQWADIFKLERVGENALKVWNTTQQYLPYVRSGGNEEEK